MTSLLPRVASNNRSRLLEARASSWALVRGEVDSVLVPAVSPSNNSNSNNRSRRLEARAWSCLVLTVVHDEVVPVVSHSNNSNCRARLAETKDRSCLEMALVCGAGVSPSNNSNSNNRSQDPARTALVMLQAKEGGKMM